MEDRRRSRRAGHGGGRTRVDRNTEIGPQKWAAGIEIDKELVLGS